MSAKEGLIAAEIPTFQALISRNVYGFVQRCLKSPNNLDKVSYEFEEFQFVQVLRVLQSYSSCVICK